MRLIVYISLAYFLSSCSSIPAPSILSPSKTDRLVNVNYGSSPSNYQKILKDYLIRNLTNHEDAKVEFINEPAKLSIDHLGDSYSGYRVCLSINEKRGNYYLGYRNHFFLINNNNVELHLYDSGLLTIPFEYCVTRDTSREMLITDIPETKEDISIKEMDEIKVIKKDKIDKIDSNIYISCVFERNERTYVFNESKNTFRYIDKLNETDYSLEYNEAFIVANYLDTELSINRVTGKATLQNDVLETGVCELTDQTKF
jgi:hypothetical protein